MRGGQIMKVIRMLAAIVITVGFAVGSPVRAEARQEANKDGECEWAELCLFWGGNYTGSSTDLYYADYNHYTDVFLAPGTGQGQVLAKNAVSAINYDANHYAKLWSSYNCTGWSSTLAKWWGVPDLGPMSNNNVSNCWAS